MAIIGGETENFCAYLPYEQPLAYGEVRLFKCDHSDDVSISHKAIVVTADLENHPVVLGDGIKVEKYDVYEEPLHFAEIEVHGYKQ